MRIVGKKTEIKTNISPEMIFVKSFTPADFPTFRNLPGKVRNLRHITPKILVFLAFLYHIYYRPLETLQII